MSEKKLELILASASPRRRELLKAAGYDFKVFVSEADESISENFSPGDAVLELAQRKTKWVLQRSCGDSVVLGSDTVVSIDGYILGKPKDEIEAKRMLTLLSGREHFVYTGVCIASKNKTVSFYSRTAVEFYPLSEKEIQAYINTKEPFDKAGAYGIQAFGSVLVKKINGDYFTVVGLPIAECARQLANFGIHGAIV